MTNTSEPKKLKDIFDKTDSVAHGPFKVVKVVGADWKTAEAFAYGIKLNLPPRQKMIFAFLVSQGLHGVTSLDLKHNIPDWNCIHLQAIMYNYKTHISYINKAVENARREAEQPKTSTIELIHPWIRDRDPSKSSGPRPPIEQRGYAIRHFEPSKT